MPNSKYIFCSNRLGFRIWTRSDVSFLTELSSDSDVMKYLPAITDPQYEINFIKRMQDQYRRNQYCFFAVDLLDEDKCIGFIGLSEINYRASFTPSVEIGWRLSKSQWNKGLATEGARRCLDFGVNQLQLPVIYAIAPRINLQSQRVMQKIGMTYSHSFIHPKLTDDYRLQDCTVYKYLNQ